MKKLKSLIVFLVLVVLGISWIPATVASSNESVPEAISGTDDSPNSSCRLVFLVDRVEQLWIEAANAREKFCIDIVTLLIVLVYQA